MTENHAFSSAFIPDWALVRPKPCMQNIYDLIGAPLRMAILPDGVSESIHLSSLRSERFAIVLPELRGRVLDIGAGDNALIKLYNQYSKELSVGKKIANQSVGVDVTDWGGGCTIIKDSANLPFDNDSFDTVVFIACINHIPNRVDALREARRVLKSDGRVIITMIGKLVGTIGHAIWWYSEDKHRDCDEHELMGMDDKDVLEILREANFRVISMSKFVYYLNTLYISKK